MRPPLPPALADDLDAVAARLRRSTVAVVTGAGARRGAPAGHGSGILWPAPGPDGTALVVTNAHVARDRAPTVVLADGRRTPARLAARDPRRDLALLTIDRPGDGPDDAPLPATAGDPRALRPGALLLALGHPLGVPNVLTIGVLHATSAPPSRTGAGSHPAMPLHDVATLRADVRLLPGNSGGPLADAAGRVVGVNTMVVGGMGVAVSIAEIPHLLDSIAPAPRLGVTVGAVRVRRGRAIHPALAVTAVEAGSPAARAGLLPGDLLLGHGGAPFADGLALRAVLRAAGAGALVPLEVGRDGRRTVRVVRLDPPDAPDAAGASRAA